MIKKLEHTAIIVNNMEDSIAFYAEMFEFKLRTRGNNKKRDMAFLYHANKPEFEIELIQDLERSVTYNRIGVVNHIAFTVEDIYKSIVYYKEKGITFHSEIPNTAIDGAKTIFFDGPNGELLQLVQPTRT